jgi:hypothetical protein
MSMPQLIGLPCVICQKSIASIVDGAFCDGCGNPIHHRCQSAVAQPGTEKCEQCGGDPASRIAKEVRGARQTEAHTRATGAPLSYPLSNKCPNCGSDKFTRERPQAWIAFAWDRVCSECNMRYTPPTPLWAAFVFIGVGLLLLGFGVVGLLSRDICVGLIGLLGLGALIHGVRSLANSGKV